MMLQIDKDVLQRKGITEEKFVEQLEMLRMGFSFLKIESPATVGNGIMKLSEVACDNAEKEWKKYLSCGGDVVKMVPASGAASRMFKNLFEFADGQSLMPDSDFIQTFCDSIEKFAFFPMLNRKCVNLYGKSVKSLFADGRHRDVITTLIRPEGLDYGQMPKALLEFHKILGGTRTPLEEHLAEGAEYATPCSGKVKIHFTFSNEHISAAKAKIEESVGILSNVYDKIYDISISVQKPSTDTVATLPDGTPYRENGELFFRPGGHGALIENLNDIDVPIVFIKNIDNVVPDSRREETNRYKRVIGGILINVVKTIHSFINELRESMPDDARLKEMLRFMHETLCVTHDESGNMSLEEKKEYLLKKLNRPVRVCGMVRNEGEPGGGPFLVYSSDGTVAPQILESTQIDMSNSEAVNIMQESTHFNPVDIVCYINDVDGKPFHLPDYIDKSTGFISSKSRKGVLIKALELPGLWNGAMSDWNTVFVEVPSATFNPVKTVNDLLRTAHQPD